MLSLGTTWELFRKQWMDETDQAFYLIWFKAGTWTQQNRSQRCIALMPKGNTHRASLALGAAPWGRYLWEPKAPGYQFPESSGFRRHCFTQMRVILSKVIPALRGDLTDPTINLKLGQSQGLGIYNRQGTISQQFAFLRSIILRLLLSFNQFI